MKKEIERIISGRTLFCCGYRTAAWLEYFVTKKM